MPLFFNLAAILCACLTGGLYFLGIYFDLLWSVTNYDVPLHLMGGLTFGLWAAAVAWRYKMPPLRALLLTICIILFVGVVWESWEYTSGLTKGLPNYWLDTSKDLADDVGGALVASGVYYLLYRKYKK